MAPGIGHAMTPAGMASTAARVEVPVASACGVDRSSRPAMKRSEKARPAIRGWPLMSGRAPRSQLLRIPRFKSTIVRVAVETAVRSSRNFSRVILSSSRSELRNFDIFSREHLFGTPAQEPRNDEEAERHQKDRHGDRTFNEGK